MTNRGACFALGPGPLLEDTGGELGHRRRAAVPGPGAAIYDLPEGPHPYIEGRIVRGSVVYNVPPGLSAEQERSLTPMTV